MTGGNCISCIHLRAKKPGEEPRCDAFPEAIPVVIFAGEELHINPYPGDHGIQFEEDLA